MSTVLRVSGSPHSTGCNSDEALAEAIVRVLEAARTQTQAVLGMVGEQALCEQPSRLMSPPIWDLGHIANFEDRWLLGALGAGRVADAKLDRLYDPSLNPRAGRALLPLLPPPQARAYAAAVRAQALAHLARVDWRCGDPLLHAGFVYGMVAQHEHQHAETLCATLQLMEHVPKLPPEDGAKATFALEPKEVLVPAGPFAMGSDDDPWALDNERPAHVVELGDFFIDARPVTSLEYRAFIEDGGYLREDLWAKAGFELVRQEGLSAPLFWRREGQRFFRRRFGRIEEVQEDEPVQHVSWYEADAYARWSGRRLPTEAEWEKAASFDPAGKRRYPWGEQAPDAALANLWAGRFGPSPAGAHPQGRSALGAEQLLGEVWEWTSSAFGPYPGFCAFPYREYSEVFFGPKYKVLRGGSWATHPTAVRCTFRNWDLPCRRQIFAGFRCARDG